MKIEHVEVIERSPESYDVFVDGKKTFSATGESAWSDAERYANDELLARFGFPAPGVFIL